MSKYFDEKGYFNPDAIMTDGIPFVFVLGGRGTGKTYGVTRWLCDNSDGDHKFLFMRRTRAELDFINAGNIYQEHHPHVAIKTKGFKIPTVFRESPINTEDAEAIGYHVALSSIQHLRGFSMLDVSYILFDEFIPERGVVSRKYAGEQMLNAYETINRNRELSGIPPVKCVFLSNFNTAESDILMSFGYRDEIYKLVTAHPIGRDVQPGKELIMINDSPISEKKKNTVLYQTQTSREFEEMSIENSGVQHLMPIKNYHFRTYQIEGVIGAVQVNSLYSGGWYLTEANEPGEINKKLLRRFMGCYLAYQYGNVSAQSDYAAEQFVGYYENS